MMISSVVRDRVSGSAASAGAAESSVGDAQANAAEEAQLTPGPSKGTLPLAELEAEARYARERYELYRARAYGPRLTSAVRLRELERKSKLAGSRLDRARADQRPLGADGASGIAGSEARDVLVDADGRDPLA